MKEKYKLSEYTENIHKSGTIWFLIVYGFIVLFPLAVSIIYNAWPDFNEFLKAALGVVPTFWAVGTVEAFTYMPMLGAGGSYLGFITGNMFNIKVPAAIQAMDQVGVQQGSEEGDCISTIAIAVSSIVTTLVVALFAVLMVPLTPIFSNPVLAPAFDKDVVVAALFGGLMVAYLAKDPKVGVPIVALGAVIFIAIPSLADIYPIILPIFAVLAVVLAKNLYKKGKL